MFEIEDWKPKDILHKIDKPSGVMYRCCDETEFFKIFKPKISLEEGIRRSLSFYKTKGK
jgi:nucleoside-diphosphate-sugar epimerase